MSASKNYAVLTGDIVSSRSQNPELWFPILEKSLSTFSERFDIYRGDSFQILLHPDQALEALFYIKARVKTIGQLDVRIGMGIGQVDYEDVHIKNSSGEAFVHSGEAFDALQKDLIAVKSPWKDWDELANSMLPLAVELANKWTNNMAETVAANILHKEASQHELARILDRKYQSQVSTELNKSNWSKINQAITYCTNQLLILC